MHARNGWSSLVVVLFLLTGFTGGAQASPTPDASPDYLVTVSGNTVEICSAHPHYLDTDWVRDCPFEGGLLRHNVKTGEVVKVVDICRKTTSTSTEFRDIGLCYVDECVAPGTYRYGFARPYPCNEQIASRRMYEETWVHDPLDNCQRVLGTGGPTPYSGTLPWTGPSAPCDWPPGGCSLAPTGGARSPGLVLLAVPVLLSWRRLFSL